MPADRGHSLPQAVIFDMDGLLVETEPVWARAEREMLAARGKTLTPDVRQQIMGLRMVDVVGHFQRVYDLADTIPALAEELTGRMVTLLRQEVVAMTGADELLAALHARQIPCAIASSSPHDLIDAVVAARGWEAAFMTRCSGNDVAHGKPAPDVYLLAAQQLGVPPAECLALEDTPTGARAAVAAAMVCYVVPNPVYHASAFEAITPHRFSSLLAVRDDLRL